MALAAGQPRRSGTASGTTSPAPTTARQCACSSTARRSAPAFKVKIKYESPIGEGAIGAYRGSCKLTLSGTVDEVRIWTTALPIKQIWGLINSGFKREPLAPDANRWFAARG